MSSSEVSALPVRGASSSVRTVAESVSILSSCVCKVSSKTFLVCIGVAVLVPGIEHGVDTVEA